MLQRILETEAMDTPDEADDYNSMDHKEVNRRFVADLLAVKPEPGDTLDLGTGTALIPIELCRQCQTCRVMAVDLAVSMLDLARLNIEIAGLIERITLQHIDAKRMPFVDGMFDTAASNSLFHHLAEPEPVLADLVRVTRPGGLLFHRDLIRPDDRETLDRLVEAYAGEANEHQQRMFADSLLASLTLEEVREMVSRLGFDPETVQATSDRHWTWSAVRG